ncbi:Fic/DOC family protein [Neptunicella marina]|uniref:protein adenylyltransferase n=1 Tax=Neptunicella marina TaxID=2125989 RepID=A0A8J6ITV0_9ALTE|nr:Fic family protein [Neptunicella marina]MBC3766144.1 Fic family protein [Neptunicella marina]
MHDKYGAEFDGYCYPDTTVLVNLLNIRNQEHLTQAETEFTIERYRSYSAPVLSAKSFTFQHFKQLHKHLFQDLYPWAGQIRTIDISKGHTRFCTCSRIEPEAKKLFSTTPDLFKISSRDRLIKAVADLYCEINLLHPFRDGNGRTQRFFFEELLFTLGYELVWPKISADDWMDANVAAVNLNLTLLENIFHTAIQQGG